MARARRVSGTARPSALAVLRLITNLVGACTGRSAGLSPPQDAIDVAARAAVSVASSLALGELGAQQLDRLLDRRALLAARGEGTQHDIGRTGERPTVE